MNASIPTVSIVADSLQFSCPDVHAEASLDIQFQRTLRLPDDERDYPLPPGLGQFPLRPVERCAGRVPNAWQQRGGAVLPMYQAAAMWLNFLRCTPYRPVRHSWCGRPGRWRTGALGFAPDRSRTASPGASATRHWRTRR